VSLPRPTEANTALVTGASSGIGAELALALAARGHHLTLVARREERLADLGADVHRRFGVEAAVESSDLSDPEERRALITRLKRRKRRVAALVNNAGFGTFGKFWELAGDREREEVRLNVDALHDLTVAFLPDMVSHRSGAIINLGSTAGFQPLPGNTTYAATKAFVNSFSEALHAELAGTGVSCTVVCPGPVETEFQETAGIGHLKAAGPGLLWATPEEVARQAVEAAASGKRVVVPGATAKAQGVMGRFTPRVVLLPVMRRFGRRIVY
jgi:short-subunit dehydrogenase